MKINTPWKLIALGTFAVIVTICAGRVMEAKTGQGSTAQSARVTPQVREAAINALGPIGLTRGQTLRIGLFAPGPHVVRELTVFDRSGNTLINSIVSPGPPNTSSFFDLNADQLPQGEFDNSGRAEVSVDWGDGNGSFSATAQVFDNLTGKTTFALQAGGHPGGIN
ncbi:MAG TPA: hypothetical protein VN937_16775 [Blastocatellia bacterium]|nr:hypothetical protein [Blastocatellia bacterium]